MVNVTSKVGTAAVTTEAPAHYVDWGAIIAGGVLAAAISSIFLAFGSAIGLTLVSPYRGESASPTALLIAAALWLLWIQISSFVGGGYLAGRMRRRIGDAVQHEVEMRDGCHGLLVWAVGVVLAGLLAGWTAMAGISGLANIAGSAAATAAEAMGYYSDTLLRSDGEAAAPATAGAPTVGNADRGPDLRAEIGRILARGSSGITDADKSHLVRLISSQTGLPEAEAKQRLDQTLSTIQQQAERARKYGILIAFLTAASLLVSAVGAWWAAGMGGKHRDEGIDHSLLTRWR